LQFIYRLRLADCWANFEENRDQVYRILPESLGWKGNKIKTMLDRCYKSGHYQNKSFICSCLCASAWNSDRPTVSVL